ncbi:phage holin family protein [Paenibacillus contaminans]|uniref:Holin n=1 Tax=Paenibacillus contaminans TaxID=450362 RepID=A0A329MRX3_9BACL|nr:phage holin family protein [Paenibacillus contaminans]RAV22685.1 hypothetical protein DQG23_00240 [Paenibacillus contaminans]
MNVIFSYVVSFFKSIFSALSSPLTYFIGLLTTSFNVALDEGIISDLSFMFSLLIIATLGDWASGAIKASYKKEYRSDKNRRTHPKMLIMFLVFFIFAISMVLSYNFNSGYFLFFKVVTWTYVSCAISNELYSMVENGEELGLPGAKRLKEMIDSLPSAIMKAMKGGK